jgi:hypothetical protein
MSEHHRISAIAQLIHDRGMSRDDAEVIALALFPLDVGADAVPVSRRFPKRIAKRTERFRKTAKKVGGSALVDLARDTIEGYCDLAVVHGEAYYIAKFEEATAGPAPWVARDTEDEPTDASEPTDIEDVRYEAQESSGRIERR